MDRIEKAWITMDTNNDDYLKSDRALYTGLLGFSAATMVQLLSIPSLDRPLYFSCICFGVAIPHLSFSLHFLIEHEPSRRNLESSLAFLLEFVGVISSLLGAIGLFFHLSTVMGYLVFALGLWVVACDFYVTRTPREAV